MSPQHHYTSSSLICWHKAGWIQAFMVFMPSSDMTVPIFYYPILFLADRNPKWWWHLSESAHGPRTAAFTPPSLRPKDRWTGGQVRRQVPCAGEQQRACIRPIITHTARSDPEGSERLLRSQITSWLTLPITRRTASSSAGGDWREKKTDTWIPPRASGKTSPSLGAWSPAAHLLSPAFQDMTLVGTPPPPS